MDAPQTPSALEQTSSQPSRQWISVPLLIPLVVWVATLVLPALFLTPRIEQIFHDFKIDLPIQTNWFLVISHLINKDYGWVCLVLIPTFVPIIFGAYNGEVAPQLARKHESRAVRFAWIAVLMTIIGMMLALFVPMIAVLQTVSGSGRK